MKVNIPVSEAPSKEGELVVSNSETWLGCRKSDAGEGNMNQLSLEKKPEGKKKDDEDGKKKT